MKRASLAVMTVLAGVGAGVARRLLARSRQAGAKEDRWLVVTVNCPPERLSELPEPLALLDEVETRVAAAPGDRGTELAARIAWPRSPGIVGRLAGADSRQAVRTALRDAKSLLETGEVLRPDSPPTTRPTTRGKIVEFVTRRASGEGRL
ncbi:hypothetical protein E1287_40485 [Actinomadura sp. KC06]|uniref:hypothetical protein n=1 Tax=Actinomadura sp. KC06 TaxID=2530369 RepID=UPI0010525B67|nr:hypothetical protein [Actinomadura sp. KC06]TDD21574.1 hypothetical protein E1287_40485 [Actinomadura sp. KC06]